ncbi:MAG: hypothetical protein AB1714_06115 [Acidobacteriota bacterium]
MSKYVGVEELECWFLVPIVRDSDRKKQQPILWRLLEEALCAGFHGWSGPEKMDWFRKMELVPGGWQPEKLNKPIRDESRKYTAFVPPTRLRNLYSFLKKVANTFDQQEILLCVAGRRKRIIPKPQDGFLE